MTKPSSPRENNRLAPEPKRSCVLRLMLSDFTSLPPAPSPHRSGECSLGVRTSQNLRAHLERLMAPSASELRGDSAGGGVHLREARRLAPPSPLSRESLLLEMHR